MEEVIPDIENYLEHGSRSAQISAQRVLAQSADLVKDDGMPAGRIREILGRISSYMAARGTTEQIQMEIFGSMDEVKEILDDMIVAALDSAVSPEFSREIYRRPPASYSVDMQKYHRLCLGRVITFGLLNELDRTAFISALPEETGRLPNIDAGIASGQYNRLYGGDMAKIQQARSALEAILARLILWEIMALHTPSQLAIGEISRAGIDSIRGLGDLYSGKYADEFILSVWGNIAQMRVFGIEQEAIRYPVFLDNFLGQFEMFEAVRLFHASGPADDELWPALTRKLLRADDSMIEKSAELAEYLRDNNIAGAIGLIEETEDAYAAYKLLQPAFDMMIKFGDYDIIKGRLHFLKRDSLPLELSGAGLSYEKMATVAYGIMRWLAHDSRQKDASVLQRRFAQSCKNKMAISAGKALVDVYLQRYPARQASLAHSHDIVENLTAITRISEERTDLGELAEILLRQIDSSRDFGMQKETRDIQSAI